MTVANSPRLVRLAKAAEYADESVSTIRRRIESGQLHVYRKPASVPGARSRIFLVDLNEIDALATAA